MKKGQGCQTSVDSSLSGLTDSGFTEHYTATSDIATRAGFRPLSKYGIFGSVHEIIVLII